MSTHPPRPRRRFVGAAIAAAMLVSACGSSGTDVDTAAVTDAIAAEPDEAPPVATTAPVDEPESDESTSALNEDQPGMVDEHPTLDDEAAAPAPPATAAVPLPALPVVDLVSGDTVQLDTLAVPGTTLLWFWAPH